MTVFIFTLGNLPMTLRLPALVIFLALAAPDGTSLLAVI
jgi:hypothetical protein